MSQLLPTARALPHAALVTGASGLLGSLLCVTLLRRSQAQVVAPVRAKHNVDDVLRPIAAEMSAQGMNADDIAVAMTRLSVCPMADVMDVAALTALCAKGNVDVIVHAAGSVDYFDSAVLDEVNVRFTENLLAVAKAVSARLVFISTAFSSGYSDDVIGERLHDGPIKDPTDYTRSKRDAERRVADSGVPFLILRPSIVVGDSSDGRYPGKPWGVYQFFAAAERLLLDKYHPEVHVVAPIVPVSALHQDAFQEGCWSAMTWLRDDSIVNIVSARVALPSMRDVLMAWLDNLVPYERVYIYDHLQQVPMSTLNRRHRMMAEFSAVNTEIATHKWDFDMSTINELRPHMQFVDATQPTLERCLSEWMKRSQRVQAFCLANEDRRTTKTDIILVR